MKATKSLLLFIAILLAGCNSTAAPSPISTEPAPTVPLPTSTRDPNTWELVWADEFDQPDGSGWGNGELQHYTDAIENSFIQDGMLVIYARQEYMLGRDYTSARLTTQFKGDWTYGKYEIRAKLPNTQGIWPAFWLLPSRARYGGGPAGGEIDIMELVGSEPGRAYGTLHFGNPAERSTNYCDLPVGTAFSDDFHIFSIEWEPDEIRWYVDGTPFHSETEWFTTGRQDALPPAPFDQDFYLLINVAVGGHWPGRPDETSVFPQMLYVDYVRVFQHPK